MAEGKRDSITEIDTEGGSSVRGNVSAGRDFIGRDVKTTTINNIINGNLLLFIFALMMLTGITLFTLRYLQISAPSLIEPQQSSTSEPEVSATHQTSVTGARSTEVSMINNLQITKVPSTPIMPTATSTSQAPKVQLNYKSEDLGMIISANHTVGCWYKISIVNEGSVSIIIDGYSANLRYKDYSDSASSENYGWFEVEKFKGKVDLLTSREIAATMPLDPAQLKNDPIDNFTLPYRLEAYSNVLNILARIEIISFGDHKPVRKFNAFGTTIGYSPDGGYVYKRSLSPLGKANLPASYPIMFSLELQTFSDEIISVIDMTDCFYFDGPYSSD